MRDTYTHGHAASVLRSHSWRTAANSAAYLLPHLRPGQSLLDVGCGPGTITVDLARLVAPGQVVGLEVVEAPLVAARANAAGSGVRFEVGDVYDLAAADGSVDVVHAHQVLQHLTDPVAALVEMRRVSRGVVAARDADYAGMFWYPLVPALDEWLTLYRAVARSNGAEPDAGRRLRSWALAAGFTDVASTASTWCFSTPDERDWWAGTWADRVTSTTLAEQALAGGLATRADLERMAGGWRTWAAADDAWFLVPHAEVLCTG